MGHRKILILSGLILLVTIVEAIITKTYLVPTLACSLTQEKVDTRIGMPESECNTDLDCQLFNLPGQKLVYFWKESETAQIGVEINTTQTMERVYRRFCENGVCLHREVKTYYLPFTFKRRNDGSLEIPTYLIEGRKCIAFSGGGCSFNVSGRIKFYRDLNGKILDIKCVTCNSTSNTINGSIEINETSQTIKIKKYTVESCDTVCGASVECEGFLPGEFVTRSISSNYYSVGLCNKTCQFIPLSLESFRAYVIDVCLGKVEISPQSSLEVTNEDKLQFYVKLNQKIEKLPVNIRVIIDITKSSGGKEEVVKRCENSEVCEAIIDASAGSYFALLTIISNGNIVKQEKTYPITILKAKECKDENCGEIVKSEYRKDLISIKKCLCGYWSCGERGGCCRKEDCDEDEVCENCVCVYRKDKLPLGCFNITLISMTETHKEYLTYERLYFGSWVGRHTSINLRAYNITMKVDFNNDVLQEEFEKNECGKNKVYVLPSSRCFAVIPKDPPSCPSLGYPEKVYTFVQREMFTSIRPGEEKIFNIKLIVKNTICVSPYVLRGG